MASRKYRSSEIRVSKPTPSTISLSEQTVATSSLTWNRPLQPTWPEQHSKWFLNEMSWEHCRAQITCNCGTRGVGVGWKNNVYSNGNNDLHLKWGEKMVIMDVGGRTDRCGGVSDWKQQTEARRDQETQGGSMASLFRGVKSADPLCFFPQDCIPQTTYPTSKAEADEAARWKNNIVCSGCVRCMH